MRKAVLFCLVCLHAYAAEDLDFILSDNTPKETHTVQKDALLTALYKIVGKTNGEQNLFFRHMEKSDWTLSLVQYTLAFGGTEFERSPTFKALRAYLEYQSGLKISGLEDLFAVQAANNINPEVINVWKKAVLNDESTWGLAQIQWKPEWTTIFGNEAEVRYQLSQNQKLGLDELYELAKKVETDSKLRGEIEWKLVLLYSMKDEPVKAAKILNAMMKNNRVQVSMDLMNMTAARLLFQNAYYDATIKYYEKIDKSSDYWVEAQEEIAWSFLRKGQPQNALAIGETLLHPGLMSLVGPEAFFVKSIGHLKVCDYSAVLESLSAYPKSFKTRLNNLVALKENPDNEKTRAVMATLKKGKLKQVALKDSLQFLPRKVLLDKNLYDLAQAEKMIQDEADTAEKIYIKTLTFTGLQSTFDLIKQRSVQRAEGAKSLSLQRIKALANIEIEEIKKVLNKLHIVEAEVIQQVNQAERIAKLNTIDNPVKTGTTGSKDKDVLIFPADKEKWFDEISNYRVNIKNGCVAKGGVTGEKVQ